MSGRLTLAALHLAPQVIQRGHFSEQEAASLIQRLLDFVAFAHSNNVIHRDLKVCYFGRETAAAGVQLAGVALAAVGLPAYHGLLAGTPLQAADSSMHVQQPLEWQLAHAYV
jgi:serine/threonine protein kinase